MFPDLVKERSQDKYVLKQSNKEGSQCTVDVQAYMVARDASGNAQPLVSVLQGIVTPDTQPPTFLFLNFTAPVVDQNTGVFAMDMIVNTSEVSNIYYSIYRWGPHPFKLCGPISIAWPASLHAQHL